MVKKSPNNKKKNFSINTQSPYYYLGVLVVALMVFGLAFWQVQHSIKAPFIVKIDKDSQATAAKLDLQSVDIESLKRIDTDQDGLSDYLEIYVYGTSAYIEDTDSDGISDKDEVIAGTNPLCVGEKCPQDITSEVPQPSYSLVDNAKTEIGIMKNSLLGLGFNEPDLAEMTDDDIRELYNETSNLLTDESAMQDFVKASLVDLSADEIRSLLLSTGASQEDLVGIADDQLLEIYQQVLQTQFGLP